MYIQYFVYMILQSTSYHLTDLSIRYLWITSNSTQLSSFPIPLFLFNIKCLTFLEANERHLKMIFLLFVCLFSQLIEKINIWIEFYVQKNWNGVEGKRNFFQRQKSLKRNREKMMMMMFETEIMRQSWVGLNSPFQSTEKLKNFIFNFPHCEELWKLFGANEWMRWVKKMKSWTIRRVSIVCWVEQSDVKEMNTHILLLYYNSSHEIWFCAERKRWISVFQKFWIFSVQDR